MKILLVDDEEMIVKGLSFMIGTFQFPGVETFAFKDAQEALEACEKLAPSLALVDINMPRINGLDFIRRAQEIVPRCRFAILSGYSEFEYAQSAVRLGCVDYLTKPVDQQLLRQLVASLLMTEYQLDPRFFSLLPNFHLFQEALACRTKSSSPHMAALLTYIDSHLDGDTSGAALSQAVGLNSKYISHLFLKETGMNISHYLTVMRLLRAAQLLVNTDMTTGDVSRNVGYLDERQFFRVFRRYLKMSPNQFRIRFRTDASPKEAP